jgi:PTH1 family peptidyl-tRNA hydrolase
MTIVVGLGNPGREHAGDRHNIGFMVLDRIASSWHTSIDRVDDGADGAKIGHAVLGDEQVLLVKPQRYMNRSGETAARIARHYDVAADAFVVVHDDMDLPVGRVRIRPGGGAGGHRGVSSIIDELGERNFRRVRLGIGHPQPGDDPVSFVLSPFAPAEESAITSAIARAAEAVDVLLAEGTASAMNRFNGSAAAGTPPS